MRRLTSIGAPLVASLVACANAGNGGTSPTSGPAASSSATPIATPTGTPTSGGTPPPAPASDAAAGATVAPTSFPSPGCATSTAPPSNDTVNLPVAFGSRPYLIHTPPIAIDGGAASGVPLPLVLNLHGVESSPARQELKSGMDAIADAEGFVVTYPSGAGSPPAWNAGYCCAFDDPQRDDVAFISSVIDSIARTRCIALDRVYVTGMSNGAFMTHRLGCELANRIAAIAPVSGLLGIPPASCNPGRPIPVLEFHGTADPVIPYDGGTSLVWPFFFPNVPSPDFPPATTSAAFWHAYDACAAGADQTDVSESTTCVSGVGCANDTEVTFCSIAGGGHDWPADGTMTPAASQRIWNFFSPYRVPSPPKVDAVEAAKTP